MLILHGDILHAVKLKELSYIKNGYLVSCDGCITGVYDKLPGEYANAPVEDYKGKLIIPAFCDMHLHAPQYPMLGMGMDMQLLEWLNTYTYPTEAAFWDKDYARMIYSNLAKELIKVGTTRVCVYSSIHRESTLILMEELNKKSIEGYVGKVNMDRNSPDTYREDGDLSLKETIRFIDECEGRYPHLLPIITPRFTPSCTDKLMQNLGKLAKEKNLRVQTHLNETVAEINWVKALYPKGKYYFNSYEDAGLFKPYTLMAHCVHVNKDEREAIKGRGAYVVHCPDSNTNLASGIAPIRLMLSEGLRVVLGSDIAGGSHISMMDVITDAIRVSKLRNSIQDSNNSFLTLAEAFYLATSAGMEYFMEKPGFQEGNALHALVLDDKSLMGSDSLSATQRLEKILYLSPQSSIAARYIRGKLISV